MNDVTVTLTVEELSFVVNELHVQGHGHGSSKDDFEPECPSCTAADKLVAARDAGDTPILGYRVDASYFQKWESIPKPLRHTAIPLIAAATGTPT